MFKTAEEFNSNVPVGTSVRYYPVAGAPGFKQTRTRSEAWTLGSGEAVVSVEGVSGGVSIRHLRIDVWQPREPHMATPENQKIQAHINYIFSFLEHAEKHVGQARECLRLIEEGESLDARLKVIGDLRVHLEFIKCDMDWALSKT